MKEKYRMPIQAFISLAGLLCLQLLLASPAAFGLTASGTVMDAQSGETLPGVNVTVKGTTTGAATDGDGSFSLSVPSLNDTLQFSFVGYKTYSAPINGRTEMEVTLQPQAVEGEEMIVVGYGTVQKSDLTGSVGTVDADAIEQQSVTNVSEALEIGRAHV